MGERTAYDPGTFCWVDLSTTDAAGAKSFYSGLFGWEFEDMPTGNGVYSMARLRGKNVCAAAEQREQEREMGVPPHWNNYVSVEDPDASAEKARELGGNVLMEPFDVMDVGRMAVIADPTGAVFCAWQPRRSIGAELVNEPATLCWNELSTHEAGKAKEFYAALFGWSSEDFGDGAYTIVRVGDKSNGGIRPMREDESGIPPYWLPYFAVEDADAAASKAAELGGNVMIPPMDVPVAQGSRIAIIADPQNAMFGIFSGQLDS
jgi:uncharacterized protein